jgi:hypothetical protein
MVHGGIEYTAQTIRATLDGPTPVGIPAWSKVELRPRWPESFISYVAPISSSNDLDAPVIGPGKNYVLSPQTK